MVKGHEIKRREKWLRTAWQASWIMNMWTAKGRSPITPKLLLGAEFFGNPEKSIYKNREEWEKHKAGIIKMARWHSKVLRTMKKRGEKGVKTSKPVTIGEFMKKAR